MLESSVKVARKLLVNEKGMSVFEEEYPYTTEFFKLLALCNTVVCEYDEVNQ
jgi:hypothetical protein